MNPHLRLALDTIACTATLMLPMVATNAQTLEEAGQAVTTQTTPTVNVAGFEIPRFQAMPPAGFEGVLPFRPACDQLLAMRSETTGMNDWYFLMNDGRRMVLGQMPSYWNPGQAHKELDNYGLCKLEGAEVPNIWAFEVPEQPAVTPATLPEGDISQVGTAGESGGGMNWPLILVGGVAIALTGCGVIAYRQRPGSVPQAEHNGFVSHPDPAQTDNKDRLQKLLGD